MVIHVHIMIHDVFVINQWISKGFSYPNVDVSIGQNMMSVRTNPVSAHSMTMVGYQDFIPTLVVTIAMMIMIFNLIYVIVILIMVVDHLTIIAVNVEQMKVEEELLIGLPPTVVTNCKNVRKSAIEAKFQIYLVFVLGGQVVLENVYLDVTVIKETLIQRKLVTSVVI